MIKKYKQYIKESLLDKITGPSREEVLENILKMNPFNMLLSSIKNDFIKGIDIALYKEPELIDNIFFINTAVHETNNTDIIFYLFELGFNYKHNQYHLLRGSLNNKNYDVSKLLIDKLEGEIDSVTIINIAKNGNYDIIKYIVDKHPEITEILLKNIKNSIHFFGIAPEYKIINYLENKLKIKESLLNKLEGPSEEE